MAPNITVPASVAKMQAKAAQLAEELRMARTQASSSTLSSCSVATPLEPAIPCLDGAAGTVASQSSAIPQTPAVFRRLSQGSVAAVKMTCVTTVETNQLAPLQCQKLEAELQLWKSKHAEATKELERRQESYMRREEQLKAQLAALMQPHDTAHDDSSDNVGSEQAADDGTADDGVNVSLFGAARVNANSPRQKAQKPLSLQEMQEQVLHGLDDLLQRQRLQMRTEEAQQLRQFRGRLLEIEAQLQACKQAAAEHQGDWMSKTLSLREELARTQDIASKLDAMYKLAEDEAAQLRVQFRAQEDDRQHLVRQLITVKRDNARLKQEQTVLQEELDDLVTRALESAADEELGSLSSASGQSSAGPQRPTSSLAAAILEVASKHGNESSKSSSVCRAGGRSRPATAGHTRQHEQAAVQSARPWSALPVQQQGRAVVVNADIAGVSIDSAVVAAKMQRYGHVIQKLQKLLESERRQLRQLRSRYTSEVGKRNELQALLLDSIQQAKQQYRAAESACITQQRQATPGTPLWGAIDSVKSGTAAATARSQPASGVPVPGSSGSFSCRQSAFSRPGSAVRVSSAWAAAAAVAAAGSSEGQPLDQAAWDQLLQQLLTKSEVLERLFDKAFPEFVAESEELGGVNRQQVGPSDTLQAVTTSQLQQLWGSQLQQQQPPVAFHETAGLGETSPTSSAHSGELLDDGRIGSESDADNTQNSSVQPYKAKGQSSSSQVSVYKQVQFDSQVQTSSLCGSCSNKQGQVVEDSNESGRQAEHDGADIEQDHRGYTIQQPLSDDQQQVALGSLVTPVMPSFPVRKPLHHTVIQRPWSGEVQNCKTQAKCSSNSSNSSSRRPTSAAATSHMAWGPLQSPTRPSTTAGRPRSAGQHRQLVMSNAFGLQPTGDKAAAATVAAAQQLPSGNSIRSTGRAAHTAGSKNMAGVNCTKPACLPGPQWTVNAAGITSSFLSGH